MIGFKKQAGGRSRLEPCPHPPGEPRLVEAGACVAPGKAEGTGTADTIQGWATSVGGADRAPAGPLRFSSHREWGWGHPWARGLSELEKRTLESSGGSSHKQMRTETFTLPGLCASQAVLAGGNRWCRFQEFCTVRFPVIWAHLCPRIPRAGEG